MKTLKIRNIVLGEGTPKIIVPIVDKTEEEILNRAVSFTGQNIDIVEWRVDHFTQVDDIPSVLRVLEGLRGRLGDKLLLFTFRTSLEGGERSITPENYMALNCAVAESSYADLVDVEVFSENAQHVITAIHAAGVKVVGSNHDFDKTPPQNEIIYRLRKMQDMGADILKIAVMAQSARDVLTLLSATEEMYSSYADRPILTMSMRGLGSISRMAGEIFGSCATFGAIGQGSAPGQVSVQDLSQVLKVIHNAND